VTGAQGRGCDRCSGTGYKGRVGLFEVMEMSEALREMVIANASVIDLKKTAMAEGMTPLRQAGLRKVAEGMTTIEEVVRETI
jgi:type IV pilus assembly protein PilB